MAYQPRIIGAPNTFEYKVYFDDVAQKKVISPFHDIPLYANAEKTILNVLQILT